MRKTLAFTLAEVLITLAIIGIVAAMTIPTLISDYQTRAWNTAADVFNRKLTEALKVMNTQQTLAGYKTTEEFVNELSKHMKISRVCQSGDLLNCFSSKIYWGNGDVEPEEIDVSIIKKSKHFGQKWDTNVLGLQFANGTNALIAYNPDCKQDPYSNQITGDDCIAILYDTSGFKTPNQSSKDLRNNGNVTKIGKTCAVEVGGKCFSRVTILERSLTTAECLAAQEKYGYQYCHNRYDNWAGAVIACDGLQNMPTSADLELLYGWLTNGVGGSFYQKVGQIVDGEGYKYNGYSFSIWTNEEVSEDSANQGYFSSSSFRIGIDNYNANRFYTTYHVCLE